MRITNGTDIVEISRIQKDIEKLGDKFLRRIFTENEIEYCEKKKNQKFQSYAARFAAKEAIYKAISEYISDEYSWKDFEVVNDENGKPNVRLGINIEELDSISVTLSHCKEYAVANVLAIYK